MVLKTPWPFFWMPVFCESQLSIWNSKDYSNSNKSNKCLGTRASLGLQQRKTSRFWKAPRILLCPQLRQKLQIDCQLQSALSTFPNALYKKKYHFLSELRKNWRKLFSRAWSSGSLQAHVAPHQTRRSKQCHLIFPSQHMSVCQGMLVEPTSSTKAHSLTEFSFSHRNLILPLTVEESPSSEGFLSLLCLVNAGEKTEGSPQSC